MPSPSLSGVRSTYSCVFFSSHLHMGGRVVDGTTPLNCLTPMVIP